MLYRLTWSETRTIQPDAAQYITFNKSKLKTFLTSSGHSRTCAGKMPNHPHYMQVSDNERLIPGISDRQTDLFRCGTMWKSNLFDLLVDKVMIHEPTQRIKGLLGDTCCSCCCVDQNVCVGPDSLPMHSLFLSVAL